ncbi:hypothetical protein TWF281_007574 [Arthrobotrys megalospora]
MVLVRDPQTGLVSDVGVNDFDDDGYADPEYGESRRVITNLHKDGISLKRLIAQKDRQQNPIRRLETDPDEPLTFSQSGADIEEHTGCLNAKERPGLWDGQFTYRPASEDLPFLNQLAYHCQQTGIQSCRHSQCLKNKEHVVTIIPKCEWAMFSDWAATLMSCLRSVTREQRVKLPYIHLILTIVQCKDVVETFVRYGKPITADLVGKSKVRHKIEIFGILEVIYWMLTSVDRHANSTAGDKWGADFLPINITAPIVAKATSAAKDIGLCPARFWNLAGVTERNQVDLPGFMEAAIKYPQLKHVGHDNCTNGFCIFNNLDSTKMEQLHKCKGKSCLDSGLLWFDPAHLNESMKEDGRTVWSIDAENPKVLQTGSYVAISHVWSDGTGIGLQRVGQVNRCLFECFAGFIKELGHEGIWWDTISIPTEREARRKAINEMHNNYANAAVTILHDQYLVDFDWKDDGSPCLALVLCPWITRGWTALELIMSNKVSIIFKGQDGQPVLKDLDDDVLAKSPGQSTRAHWIASSIIRRLRKRDITNVSNLMAILKPRTTSWERDRLIIAALLSGVGDVPANIREDEITKKVIDHIHRLNRASLLHGKVTLSETGGWSWCPPSVYNLPVDTFGDLADEERSVYCLVDKNGVLAGHWHYRLLEKEEVVQGRIISISSEMTVIMKTEDALRRWEYCLLLRETNKGGSGLGFLVMPVKKRKDFIHCRFIGAVRDVSPVPQLGYDPRYSYEGFKIGADEGGAESLAKNFIRDWDNTSDARPGQNFDWLRGKLWMGDSLNGQLLVMRPGSKDRATDAFVLTISQKESQGNSSEMAMDMSTQRQILNCNPYVAMSPTPLFTVRTHRDGRPDSKSREKFGRLTADQSWPPRTIPAKDRTFYDTKVSTVGAGGRPSAPIFSEELFVLRTASEPVPIIFAAINETMFTPTPQRPYQGVWAASFPVIGYDFLLFHQPSEAQLEIIKLTGGPLDPRGSPFVIANDLKSNNADTSAGWPGRPNVPVDLYRGPSDTSEPATLVLVSPDEALVVADVAIIQCRRIQIKELMTG